ncbi:MAG: hypothetical protein PF693_20830 [Spirochaetia bacterium]|jgi:abortive infection bacteriophage resistance protein|nr:hypothetical protein [Spirochaetia bacterium]
MLYNKPFKGYSDQVKILQSCGLIIDDLEKAELILKQINYYRFSAYSIQFQDVKDIFNLDLPVKKTITDLLNSYSSIPICVKTGMGFPENHESVWLWSDKG